MEKYFKESTSAAITLPFLFTWIYGILKFPIKSIEFAIALHTGILSLVFLFLYGLLNIGNIFFEFPGDNPLMVAHSILSSFFLILSVVNFLRVRNNKTIPGLNITQSLLDRLFQGQN